MEFVSNICITQVTFSFSLGILSHRPVSTGSLWFLVRNFIKYFRNVAGALIRYSSKPNFCLKVDISNMMNWILLEISIHLRIDRSTSDVLI